MDFSFGSETIIIIVFVLIIYFVYSIIAGIYHKITGQKKVMDSTQPRVQSTYPENVPVYHTPQSTDYNPVTRWSGEFDESDITSYESTVDIFKSGNFTAEERREEYIRRGKSPSGVIDGIYNDTYRDEEVIYNDCDRDWDAGA